MFFHWRLLNVKERVHDYKKIEKLLSFEGTLNYTVILCTRGPFRTNVDLWSYVVSEPM